MMKIVNDDAKVEGEGELLPDTGRSAAVASNATATGDTIVEIDSTTTTTKLSPAELRAAYAATESDDALRNVDVLMKMQKQTLNAVVDWLLRHNCRPKIYEENAAAGEGRDIAERLLNYALKKLKKEDLAIGKSRRRTNNNNNGGLEFRLAPFAYPPWRVLAAPSAAARERSAEVKRKRAEKEMRLRELRARLKEKEERLKKLKLVKELAPTEEFTRVVEIKKNRKRIAAEQLAQLEREMEGVKKRFRFYEKELPKIRKRKKSCLNINRYYRNQLTTLSTLGPKAAAAERNRADAEERLERQREELKTLKEDRDILSDEKGELEGRLEERREAAFFHAMTDSMPAGGGYQSEEPDPYLSRASRRSKYRTDVMDVVDELLEIGIEIESVETIFESVLQCIKCPVRRFPAAGVIKRLRSKKSSGAP